MYELVKEANNEYLINKYIKKWVICLCKLLFYMTRAISINVESDVPILSLVVKWVSFMSHYLLTDDKIITVSYLIFLKTSTVLFCCV